MNERLTGALILFGSLGFGLLYVWWLLFSPWGYYALVSVALVAVLGFSVIATWIGYTMVTTPSPPQFEDTVKTEEVESQDSSREGV